MSKHKQEKEVKQSRVDAMGQINRDAAGIDIGAEEVYVAVPPDRDKDNVRSFPTFTADLQSLIDWLKACRIDTVAMESTGVYWIPLFEILKVRGFQARLVNSQHLKNVSGRKKDTYSSFLDNTSHALSSKNAIKGNANAVLISMELLGNSLRNTTKRSNDMPNKMTSEPKFE